MWMIGSLAAEFKGNRNICIQMNTTPSAPAVNSAFGLADSQTTFDPIAKRIGLERVFRPEPGAWLEQADSELSISLWYNDCKRFPPWPQPLATLEPRAVRYVYGLILLVFLGAIGLFAAQNTHTITVRFWSWAVTAPVAVMAIAAYLLGMLSGWNVVGFMRSSIRRVSVETHHREV